MNATHRKYRIKSKSRLTAFIMMTAVLLMLLCGFAFGGYAADGAEIDEYIQVTVSYGDTLWDLAREYMPSDMDLREAVYILADVNDVSADYLEAGMVLNVPTHI